MFVLHDTTSDSESQQSAQTSVEGEVHSKVFCGRSTQPGGGALVQGRTESRRMFGNVSLHSTYMLCVLALKTKDEIHIATIQ